MFDLITINEVKIKIGQLCKQKRQFYNLSQEQLAENLAMSRITIQKLEKGKNVTVDTFLKVLNHFDKLESFHSFLIENTENQNIPSLY